MATPTTAVIVGANFAGHAAATALRKHGFDGRVVMIGDEPERPYERPPLSKDYLLGLIEPEEFYLASPSSYAKQEIELWLGTPAMRLDPEARTVTLADGR